MTDRPILSFNPANSRADGARTPDSNADPFIDPAYRESLIKRRFWAWVVDQICIWAAIGLGFLLVALLTVVSFGLLSLFGLSVLVAVPFLYHGAFVLAARGTTFGMMVMKLVVRRAGGGEPEIGEAAIRVIVYFASNAFFSPLVLLIALFNDKRQTLHDFLTGTVVVRDI